LFQPKFESVVNNSKTAGFLTEKKKVKSTDHFLQCFC